MKNRKKCVLVILILTVVATVVFFGLKEKVADLEAEKLPEATKDKYEIEVKLEKKDVVTGYSASKKNRYAVHPTDDYPVLTYMEDYFTYEYSEVEVEEVKYTGDYKPGSGEVQEKYAADFKKGELRFYDYGNHKVVKTIDVAEVLNGKNFPYILMSSISGPVLYQGRQCIKTRGELLTEEGEVLEESPEYTLFIDTETFEIYREEDNYDYDSEEIRRERKEAEWKLEAMYSGLKINNGIHDVVVRIRYDYDKRKPFCLISLPGTTLPKENEKLYTEFPDLKKYQGQEEKEIKLIFFEIPTNEEILKLLLPEGKDVSYEGYKIKAEDSIDGKEHQLSSIDDYYVYKYGVHLEEGPTQEYYDNDEAH